MSHDPEDDGTAPTQKRPQYVPARLDDRAESVARSLPPPARRRHVTDPGGNAATTDEERVLDLRTEPGGLMAPAFLREDVSSTQDTNPELRRLDGRPPPPVAESELRRTKSPGPIALVQEAPAPRPAGSLVGTMLGEYRVTGPLGEGAMGVVYRGEHPVIGKAVAIKVLRREFASDPAHARRFRDEARLVNASQHPGLVDVFAFGETPTGEPYLVMELLEGEPLDVLLQRRGALPAKEAVQLLLQMLGALGAAHGAGVIHRDLKPANVFVMSLPDGATYVKLLDFGLAKRGAVGTTMRQTSVGGTPLYLAPEQARGEDIGPQTDLYSLGCLAYELLTGAPPFTSANLHELLDAHRSLAPRPLRSRGVPPGLERIVLQLLAKDPALRPQSAAEVREALEGELGKLSSGEQQTRIARMPTSDKGTDPAMPMPGGTKRPLWLFVVGGLLLFALGAGVATLLLRSSLAAPQTQQD